MEVFCSFVSAVGCVLALAICSPDKATWDFKSEMFTTCLKSDSCEGRDAFYRGYQVTITSVDVMVIPRSSDYWVLPERVSVRFNSNLVEISVGEDGFKHLEL